MKKEKNSEVRKQTNAVLNAIAPVGFRFNVNDMSFGENKGINYGIIKYPTSVQNGWLSKITNLQSSIVTLNFTPITDNAEVLNIISHNINDQRLKANDTNNNVEAFDATETVKTGQTLIQKVHKDNEVIGTLSTWILPFSKNEQYLGSLSRSVLSRLASLNLKSRVMAYKQIDTYQSMLPTYEPKKTAEDITKRIVPLSTFIGGFPFATTGINDGTGYYIGKDSENKAAIVDFWKRGEDRANSNIVVLGQSGLGKSTIVKSLILSEFMNGTKIIIIDPEAEYIDITNNLEGSIINAGGGKSKINPLQIKVIPDTETEENDEDDEIDNSLVKHLKSLEVFFQLYTASTDFSLISLIKKYITLTYNKFGIEYSTKINEDTKFPTFSDVYEIVKNDTEMNVDDKKTLETIFYNLAEGDDAFLWNGESNISMHNQITCFNTKSMSDYSNRLKATQYFNILTYAWDIISKNKNERVMFVCDESYLAIDQNIPQTLITFRNMAKRIRKYEGMMVIISHELVDFLADGVKQYGQAVFSMPTYKIIMGTEAKNLKEIDELYALSNKEKDLLLSRKRGKALFMVGAKRMEINFYIPDWKFDYMGKGGGR